MHGAFFFAWSNKSRTRDAPTPTNISTKSEPEIERNGTFASPATAFASRVFPVPGGPTNRAPFGIFAPSSRYLGAFFRKSTISIISTFASSKPATSLNVTRLSASSLSNSCARALPTFIIPPCAPPPRAMPRIRKNQIAIIAIHGNSPMSHESYHGFSFSNESTTLLPVCSSAFSKSALNESTEPILKKNWCPLLGICLYRKSRSL